METKTRRADEMVQLEILKDCLQKQIDEFDMISSIFCNPGEFHVDDHSIAADFNELLAGKLDYVNSQLDYCITVNVNNIKLNVKVILPHLYPNLELPYISVRSSELHKSQENDIKNKIEEYLSTIIDKSEPYIYQVVAWLQDNAIISNIVSTPSHTHVENKIITMERLWIYSHHIKSKTKRQNIVKNARELNLTGFSLPGKPGIICVEGLKEDTEEFWRLIKLMHWQKITIKKSEIKNKNYEDAEKFRKFTDFHEELFADVGDDKEVILNMSNFMKFLEMHNCIYVKKDLFGFE